ncbi:MAG TPA: baseplate J/gp47 family protein [Ktedonobacteraceae bacterium]|nr:baseplate J/gp47 family protein [Ktedonobacteraceae bacterium]
MKQGNGADLFGAADSRSGNTGIIIVTPDDDREGVVAAILTQDKLGRKQILLVLPAENKAFHRPVDFDGLKNMRRRLQAQLIIVAPSGSAPAEFARQRRFAVYSSLEAYKNSQPPGQESRSPTPPAPDAHEPVSPAPLISDVPEQGASETGDLVPENIDTSKYNNDSTGTSEMPEEAIENPDDSDLLPPILFPPSKAPPREPDVIGNRQIIYLSPEDDLAAVKERLQNTTARSIVLVVPPETQLRSHVVWKLIHGHAREAGKDVLVVSSDEAIRAVVKAAGFQEADSLESISSSSRKDRFQPVTDEEDKLIWSEEGPQQAQPSTPSSLAAPHPPVGRRGGQRQRSRSLSILTLAIIAVILLAGVLFWFYATHSAYASSATVTIIPARAAQDHRYTITAVTGQPNAAQRQVQARILSYTTSTQTMTVKATGQGTIPAVAAVGNLIFYNALPYSQTIAPGTILTDSSGVQIMNTKIAIIPAANLPTEGSITVTARAVVPGATGNIPALDFNAVLCCIPGITVVNTAAFSGGHDQQHYTYVQQADINSVASTMKNSLAQNGESVLKTLLPPNEPLVGSIRCVPAVASDHSAGERAASVTISATDTCTGETYDQQAALAMAGSILRSEAASRLGAGFALAGSIVATVRQAAITTAMNTVSLSVEADGTWVYRFTADRQSALAKLIAGKSGQAAKMLLQQQRGVSTASIQASILFPWLDAAYLPADARQITIKMQG